MAAVLRHTVPAHPAAASVVRQHVRHWLTELAWPEDEADNVVLAVSEAVCNSIEHAYPDGDPDGLVRVSGESVPLGGGGRQLLITVCDHGRWRPVPENDEGRRRGIPLMRALTESLDVIGTAAGTRVTLTTRPVAAPRRLPWVDADQSRVRGLSG